MVKPLDGIVGSFAISLKFGYSCSLCQPKSRILFIAKMQIFSFFLLPKLLIIYFSIFDIYAPLSYIANLKRNTRSLVLFYLLNELVILHLVFLKLCSKQNV